MAVIGQKQTGNTRYQFYPRHQTKGTFNDDDHGDGDGDGDGNSNENVKNAIIVGLHLTSLKFRLQNYRSHRDFTFTMY